MYTALIIMLLLAFLLGIMLGYASIRLKVEADPLVEQIDDILPQTQCGQCGYLGCRPYAEAIASGEAEINRCVPGGDDGIVKLAQLLNREVIPLAIEHAEKETVKGTAVIDESLCIGCTRCIQACPVDAISGAAKQIHTVIQDQCTGCTLCVSVCPVDCITMRPMASVIEHWKWQSPILEKEDQS